MTTALEDKVSLGLFPTPLHGLPEVPGLLVKRDDLSGFGMAGNKTRSLEFLIADACATRSVGVVSGGMPTSNFVGALAEAACRHRLACHLLVPEPITPTPSVCLARLLGAAVEGSPLPREAIDEQIAIRASELGEPGSRYYPIPRGGATEVGALGFVRAAAEIAQQHDGDRPMTIVIPVGSGTSIAGLVAGVALIGVPFSIVGVSVSRPIDEMGPAVRSLARAAIIRAGGQPERIAGVPLRLVDGEKSLDAASIREAMRSLACRGIVMDGHYGLPTWGIAEQLARESTQGDGPVVLWHTGGLAGVPALLQQTAEA